MSKEQEQKNREPTADDEQGWVAYGNQLSAPTLSGTYSDDDEQQARGSSA